MPVKIINGVRVNERDLRGTGHRAVTAPREGSASALVTSGDDETNVDEKPKATPKKRTPAKKAAAKPKAD